MLEFRQVSKSFAGVQALEEVSFNVSKGTIHALAGENGAGKSTLMKILSGVHRRYLGEVRLRGNPLDLSGPKDALAHGIAIIHQELNLILGLSVVENFFLGRELRTARGTLDLRRMRQATVAGLARVGLNVSPNARVESLRVAEQQLVEIAKALSLQAELLILDEPTSALSEREITGLICTLKELRTAGVTMIYISHKLDEIFALADEITVLRDGKHVSTGPAAETDENAIVRAMVGRDILNRKTERKAVDRKEVLRIQDLSVSGGKGKRQLVGSANLSVHEGEVVGLAGLMGAGRSELLGAIFGAHPVGEVSGDIFLSGEKAKIQNPRDALSLGIAMVTEDRKNLSLIPAHPVTHNITLPSLSKFLHSWFLSTKHENAAVSVAIKQLGVKAPSGSVPAETLSGGNQQKLVLAKCLMTEPRVLLLDEPTRGIDVGSKDEIYQLVMDLTARGVAVLMASSELPEILSLCDRIVVMAEGRLVEEMDRSEATEERVLAVATPRTNGSVNGLTPPSRGQS